MRKIEKQMRNAINSYKPMKGRNTAVRIDYEADTPRAHVYLHRNHIATYWYRTGVVEVNIYNLSQFPTVTTKSRLRALGVNVYTRNHVTYLDGKPVA